MSSRSTYRLRLLSVLGAVLGVPASPPGADAAIDRAPVEQLSVSEKLADIREATTVALERLRENGGGGDLKAIDDMLTAQWFNWGNWRNWANWQNWQNWGNWYNG